MPNVFHRLEKEKKCRLDSKIDGEHSSGNKQRLGNKTTHTKRDLSKKKVSESFLVSIKPVYQRVKQYLKVIRQTKKIDK